MHLMYSGCLLTCESNAATQFFMAKFYQRHSIKVSWVAQVFSNQEWEVASLGGEKDASNFCTQPKTACGIKVQIKIANSKLLLFKICRLMLCSQFRLRGFNCFLSGALPVEVQCSYRISWASGQTGRSARLLMTPAARCSVPLWDVTDNVSFLCRSNGQLN